MAKKDFLTLADFSQDDIYRLLSKSLELKRRRRDVRPLAGKTVALIFSKPSTRTRVSFEAAVAQLGGTSMFLSAGDLQLGRGEPLTDTGKVLSRYVDAVVVRTHSHADLETLAVAADIPVINALTERYHPCQALADMLTVLEKKDRLAGIKMAYIGDGNNVCNSLIIAAAKVGINMRVASPAGYQPDEKVLKVATASTKGMNGIKVFKRPATAAKDADVLYTDVWTSMGQEEEARARRTAFAGYQINEELLGLAAPKAIVMHCLPAHRGEEITAEVLEGKQSVVFDQAENRLHAQKALLAMLIAHG